MVFMFGGIKTTTMWTQAELAKNLTKPDIEIVISVNATTRVQDIERKKEGDIMGEIKE